MLIAENRTFKTIETQSIRSPERLRKRKTMNGKNFGSF
ncbi:hypothetical protein LEP1GSC037_5636 [Leptospira interrogans str. 2006001854]|uniref:Uncharacterized protein n=1 Tax=Leptospira interrogans str. 2006001854 TaxID=1001590 RepID=M6G9I5_LEPIR|nr:hypothetical protein LEP1GSC037_5636 [Leptospira interrogans str. 2006001854]